MDTSKVPDRTEGHERKLWLMRLGVRRLKAEAKRLKGRECRECMNKAYALMKQVLLEGGTLDLD